MTVPIAAGLFVLGILLIFKGGDVFVDAASWLSEAMGVSKAVIGATVVSLATTLPEYLISTIAVLKGYNGLSIGNAVGSLIANIGLAFALLCILAPGKVTDRTFGVKGALMLLATGLLWAFCLDGSVTSSEGVALLAVFAVSVFVNIRYSKDDETGQRKSVVPGETARNMAKFVAGAAAIVFGSNLIVDNAQFIARRYGVSEALIGLTVVAAGASLPELVTSAAAIIKKQNAISIGNIIGANILDATLILSTGAFVSGGGLAVSRETVRIDLPMALLLMLITVIPTAMGKKIYCRQGFVLFAIYAAYIVAITFFL